MSTGAAGSGTAMLGYRILEAAGLDPQARHPRAEPRRRAVGRRAEGRQDRRVLLERRPADGLDPRPGEHAAHPRAVHRDGRDAAAAREDLRSVALLPGHHPEGHVQQDTDVPVVGVADLLVVSETMPEALAHDITRVLFDKQPELATIHPQAKVLSLEDGDDGIADSVPSRRDPLLPRPAGVDELSAGAQSRVTSVLAFALAAYALYWVVGIVEPHIYRISFLLLALRHHVSGRPSGARPKRRPPTTQDGAAVDRV